MEGHESTKRKKKERKEEEKDRDIVSIHTYPSTVREAFENRLPTELRVRSVVERAWRPADPIIKKSKWSEEIFFE